MTETSAETGLLIEARRLIDLAGEDRIRAALADGAPEGASGGRLDPAAALQTLSQTLEQAPKGRRWKLRDRIGERKRWYEVPEGRARLSPRAGFGAVSRPSALPNAVPGFSRVFLRPRTPAKVDAARLFDTLGIGRSG